MAETQPSIGLQDAVAARVREMREENIDVREAAMSALVALGPDVLPEIRGALDRETDPDTAARLKAVVTLLEEQDRLVKLVGRPRLITMRPRKKPVREVFADISSQSGVPVEVVDVPAKALVSAQIVNAPLWEAVSLACRSHGHIRPEWSADRVTIRPGAFQESAHVDWNVGPIPMGRLLIEYAMSHPDWTKKTFLAIRGLLLLSPGRRYYKGEFFIDDANVAGGPSLRERHGEYEWVDSHDEHEAYRRESPNSICVRFQAWIPDAKVGSATEIQNTSGRLHVRISLGTKSLSALRDLTPDARASDSGSRVSIHLKSVTRTESEFKADAWMMFPMLTSRFYRIDGVDGIRLVSKSGAAYSPTSVSNLNYGGSMGSEDWKYEMTFAVASTVELASLELLQPDDDEQSLSIDFDFPRLPIRTR